MLTYELKKQPGLPLYEALYRCIREDILTGRLQPGEKLPSKRALAENLEVSKITVEAAYGQLLSEGFLRSEEKRGYFVEDVPKIEIPPAVEPPSEQSAAEGKQVEGFPFSVWSKLQREVLLDYGQTLLQTMPNRGVAELRLAIARHLASFRGMQVDPECILIGAGADFLYNILIQLLGRKLTYAVEDPGYGKIRKIYAAGGVSCRGVAMDREGVKIGELGDARVLHITPNHHFPTGLVTRIPRRQEILAWARETGSWIIEDDYDSEFRFDERPMRAMQTMAPDRVIYMNSFSKSLAPSIRISYLVLPKKLMDKFQEELGFYSCTVPSFEQYTLARFLSRGHFEKHINRMRKFYRARRNRLLNMVRSAPIAPKLTVLEQDAGLHFLLKVDTSLNDGTLTEILSREGIFFPSLGEYFWDKQEDLHTLVVNYAVLSEETMEKALEVLGNLPER